MSYATREDIEMQFGIKNVKTWADLENNGDELYISSRIEWALEKADEEINVRLREGPYEIPFDPVPSKITDLAAIYAGIRLYDSRGAIDYDANGLAIDQLQIHRTNFQNAILEILNHRIRFDANLTSATYPRIIVDE